MIKIKLMNTIERMCDPVMEKKKRRPKAANFAVKSVLIFFLAFFFFFLIDRAAIYLTDLALVGSFGFTWLSLHHTIQIVMAVAIMALPWWHLSLSGWGLNFKNSDLTLKIILKFSIGWIIGTTIFTLVTQWLGGWLPLLDFYLSIENILIYLIFESIIVGISEEIVFRGLVYGTLSPYFSKKMKIGFSISYAGIISAVFFAIAHIGFQISPFSITAFAPMQIFIAFALGIFYAVLREKTGSLLGPILAHNISDGWLSILYIVIQLITQGN
jgi:membrane protease YdiL (CAAX protease family)